MTWATYELGPRLNIHPGVTSGNRDTVSEPAAMRVLCNQIGYI